LTQTCLGDFSACSHATPRHRRIASSACRTASATFTGALGRSADVEPGPPSGPPSNAHRCTGLPAGGPERARISIPARNYLLFRGQLSQARQWGAADLVPGRPRPINIPNLIWPADHLWFLATEIDLPWTGIAGTTELLEDLIADESPDVELIQLTRQPPYRRHGDSQD